MFFWIIVPICTIGFLYWFSKSFMGMLVKILHYEDLSKVTGKIPPNTVCLFQVGRGPGTPSLSPFPLKLETFLRMANIPYMNDHSAKFSKKQKTPWMIYNGQRIEDSQICVDFLKEKSIGLDVNEGLTDEELGVARAFRAMTEENLYWTMCYELFIRTPAAVDILLKDIFPKWKILIFKKGVCYRIKTELWEHGIGRHSDSEIWEIAKKDLRALSRFLGSKPFLLGDRPHEVDCTVFGMLAMVVWQMKATRLEHFLGSELPNLIEFCERMRDIFWPDWDQRCKGENFEDDDGKIYSFSS